MFIKAAVAERDVEDAKDAIPVPGVGLVATKDERESASPVKLLGFDASIKNLFISVYSSLSSRRVSLNGGDWRGFRPRVNLSSPTLCRLGKNGAACNDCAVC